MGNLQTYYYDNQLRRYIVQMMAIFGGMQVQVGWRDDKEPELIAVPIANASRDRVVAWIKGEQTQNKMIRLPMFTIALRNLELATDLQKGVGQSRRNVEMPIGGLFPDDIRVIHQRMPIPYRAQFELSIWASNQDQHFQILEQIGILFDPTLQIQTSDDVMDWTRVTSVTLKAIRFEDNFPPATDRRIIQTTMDFETVIYLSCPADVRKQYVAEIFVRVGAVSQNAQLNFDIIEELDEQNVPYESIVDVKDVDLSGEN